MERLTPSNLKKVCYDTWELCGLDDVCKRDCRKPVPCKIPNIIYRLAKYEDTGLTPEEIEVAIEEYEGYKRVCGEYSPGMLEELGLHIWQLAETAQLPKEEK